MRPSPSRATVAALGCVAATAVLPGTATAASTGRATPERIQAFCGGFTALRVSCSATVTAAPGQPPASGIAFFESLPPLRMPLAPCRLMRIPGPPGSPDLATCTTPDLRHLLPSAYARTPDASRDFRIRVTYGGDRHYAQRRFGATLELRPVPPLPPGAPPLTGPVESGLGPPPRVGRLRLRPTELGFRLTQPGTTLVAVERREGRSWRTARSAYVRSGPAGARVARWSPALAPGRYRVLTVTGWPDGGVARAAARELRLRAE